MAVELVNGWMPPVPAINGKAFQLLSVSEFLYSSAKTRPFCVNKQTLKLLLLHVGVNRRVERTGDPSETNAKLCAPPPPTAMIFVAAAGTSVCPA